jgi:apolipoprotein N-acyltransferase
MDTKRTPNDSAGCQLDRQSNRRVLGLGLLGTVLLWSSFPPLHVSYLAYVALIPWLMLIDDRKSIGRSGYFYLWVAGALLWLALVQGIRLAFWPLYFGWAALGLYLGIYVPLFVGISRIAVHAWRIPVAISATGVWVGMELIRGYALTGFSGCLLAHTQVDHPVVLQIADQFGGYGVGAFVVLANVFLWRLFTGIRSQRRSHALECAGALGLCVVVLLYGWSILLAADSRTEKPKPMLRVALIQENAPTQFESNEEKNAAFWQAYLYETQSAAKKFGAIDVVAWPESVFTGNVPLLDLKSPDGVPPELAKEIASRDELEQVVENLAQAWQRKTRLVLSAARTPVSGQPTGQTSSQANGQAAPKPRMDRPYLLMGSDAVHVYSDRVDRMNAALWIGPDGKLIDVYAKKYLVMFGEYIPFAGWVPGLLRSIGMAPIRSGTRALACRVGDVVLAPSICFENMIPTASLQQVRELSAAGDAPDILINISNDSWFHGTSMLDHHLNCGILTAVENRRPMLVAANTGLSAWIDAFGRKIHVSERGKPGSVLAEPTRDYRWGLWQTVGDWPARICGVLCILLAWSGLRSRRIAKL